jgi:holo-[acyl-carrier protein] synthase
VIVGIGCDIERVAALDGTEALRIPGLVFTEAECGYASEQPHCTRTLTGHFAAKEAFFKSLPEAVGFYWTDVEVVHDARRAPRFRFSGEMARVVEERNWDVKLSISHSGEYAVAFVAVSGRP